MNTTLILSCILSVLCHLLAVDRSVSANLNPATPIISTAEPSREGKVLRSLPFISSEAVISNITGYVSTGHVNRGQDWVKRALFLCLDPKLIIFSQPGLNRLREIHSPGKCSFLPLYLRNRVLQI